MSKFITKFETQAAYEAAQASLFKPNVSLVTETHDVEYNPLVSVTGVTLNKSELSLNKGATETLVATVLPSDASNKGVTWSSSNDSIATVSSNGLVTAVGGGNANITVTTVDGGHTAQCAFNIIDPYGGHDYVEIGGLKWATMNVGANSVTDYGLYFQWGDTQGYTAAQVGSGSGKKYFGWVDYKYSDGTSNPYASAMTKYNSTDGKTVLDASDDAVQAAWGGSWRMPTKAEFALLSAAVNTAWTSNYNNSGVAGMICTDNTDSSKKLFFPAAGYFRNGNASFAGDYGWYWSRSLYDSSARDAYTLESQSSGAQWQSRYYNRYYGLPVRGLFGE